MEIERSIGDQEWIGKIEQKMPKLVRKQRRIRLQHDDGEEEDGGWEEYIEYSYPDDPSNFREPLFLRKAHLWNAAREKKQKENEEEAQE